MAGKDFYQVLGVKRDATEKEIRSAYRKLARQHHPDVNPGDKAAEARFKDINAAYEVLKDADKRKKYDKYGDRWEMADQIEEAQRRAGSGDFFRRTGTANGTSGAGFDLGDIGSGFDDILGGLFRGRGRTPVRPLRGEDLEYPTEITLEEAFTGTTRLIQLQVPETCTYCNGTGKLAGQPCATCDGLGSLIKSSRLEVKIPPGVDTGSKVRVAGKGNPGQAGGGPGDMMILVTVRPNEQFERKGADIYVDVLVPVEDMVLGGEAMVPTPKGSRLALKIPAGTQNGRTIRLAGQGMPKLGSDGRGDLYARIKAVLPTEPSERERQLFEELRRMHGGARAGVA